MRVRLQGGISVDVPSIEQSKVVVSEESQLSTLVCHEASSERKTKVRLDLERLCLRPRIHCEICKKFVDVTREIFSLSFFFSCFCITWISCDS